MRSIVLLAALVMASSPAAPPRPSSGGGQATPAVTRPATRAMVGINPAGVAYWTQERTFANLAAGDSWRDTGKGWSDMTADRLDANGYPREIARGAPHATLALVPPESVLAGKATRIRCTWTGTGELAPSNKVRDVWKGDHTVEWTWEGAAKPVYAEAQSWLDLGYSKQGDPLRDLDCREKDMARDAVFAPAIIAALKPFSVLRFLDWSQANANPENVTWATRATPSMVYSSVRGVPIERMLDLANTVGAAPWFTVPYNADEDYQRRMATMVHAAIPAGRQVYVELGNEPWNYAFPVATQTSNEAKAQGIPGDQWQAGFRRYADKSVWMFGIWSAVFADRPGQLVRVLNSQNANPDVAESMLGWKDVARHVDALAIAPYFGQGVWEKNPGVTNVDPLMAWIQGDAHLLIDQYARANLKVAQAHNVRLITYEAGQHVLEGTGGVDLLAAINRDPRMGRAYAAYWAEWKALNPDLMTFYSATGPAGKSGAWGIREFGGQPLAETPKRQAVLAAAAAVR